MKWRGQDRAVSRRAGHLGYEADGNSREGGQMDTVLGGELKLFVHADKTVWRALRSKFQSRELRKGTLNTSGSMPKQVEVPTK